MSTERKTETIYLAGGCFWGMEKLFRAVDGVVDVTVGYANGKSGIDPNYQLVCTGTTGFKETIKVDFDPEAVSLEKLLLVYYSVIDPTVVDQQGADRGHQYQTGVYHITDDQKPVIDSISEEIKKLVPLFMVELEPLQNFFTAEEYHQRYLEKNPGGYCHIPSSAVTEIAVLDEQSLRDYITNRRWF